ncbi:MAG: hypothetical protein UW74_C0039G0003 [Candidatus Giovannonibacteria bacterium GW2011_GWC2_44_8]|uniref:Uncharacterized protein n=5 Tax=Candidatus Giovannoniibacteriota TaxID=1752738 RepID=A0A1F5XC36_9BACT|nr:MAG: hypothetical protein UW55_C0021G0005 [Candidatus Giovannonibacteria bacterium GW2011_GWA2_44_26]KKT77540.1 MAG: hypothetical protein UW74_C0039G0003 [Candidatus Giovannonibacteria bacterium GW2011_GWC2_44_8]OGF73385.1 MAG: hypothetical protein A2W57_02750 [Candidatus Giovannonibacteria bacterium RIFCSPHIGHO2_02_43_16]OGF85387.1 MAG: hypothetical protein A2Z63_00025 [Candidatus Giovannonibacteria bacterium RIFCSPLOWO2_02_44_8]OGF95012.1 MAG: hypothetical protein A2Y47_00300 [Candidatus G
MSTTTISLPKKIFEDFVRATEHFERTQDELENYFLSQNKQFVARVKKLRSEHKKGKFSDWGKMTARYGL